MKISINAYLWGNQHDVLSKISIVSILIELSDKVARWLDTQYQPDVINADFAKAFDYVDHEVLL